jgi:hypothetical protein
MSRVKRTAAVTCVLAVAALVLAACAPTKPPPPPPTDPHDVLVVGDSISYSFGCVLGDPSGGSNPCPAPGGGAPFTAKSAPVGGCTISGGAVLFYNHIATSDVGCSDYSSSWAQLADENTPKLVIIVTSGWEIMDRWSDFPAGCDPNDAFFCPTPDRQWGAGSPANDQARLAYAQNLSNAVNIFRNRGAKVLVANSMYVNPPQPEFAPGTPGAPDFLINAWYERYPAANTAPPPVWNAPNQGLSYRSSKTKVDEFNSAITQTLGLVGDPDVTKFNFFSHFDPTDGTGPAYSDKVCPPPNDGANPTSCPGTAITVHDADGGHLTPTGGHDVLAAYLVSCVRGLLSISGGDTAKCS